MHTAVYERRPETGCVSHTHSPCATAFAVAGRPSLCWSEAAARFGMEEGVPVAAYGPRGSQESVNNIRGVITPRSKAVLLANHGILAFHESSADAVRVCTALEETAQLALYASALGGPQLIPPEMLAYTQQRVAEFAAAIILIARQTANFPLAGDNAASETCGERRYRLVVDRLAITRDDVLGRAHALHHAIVDPNDPIADCLQCFEIVGYDKDRAVVREILEKSVALCAESLVADRERFVHDQDIRVGMGANGKCKSRRHAARIEFERLIKEVANTREGGDFGKPRLDGGAPHAENGAADQSIFPAGQLIIEAGAKSEDRRNPPLDLHTAERRQSYAADDLQERGFAGAVAADDANAFAAANLEADVPQHPMLMVELLPMPEDCLFELIVAPHIELERLADPVAADDEIR